MIVSKPKTNTLFSISIFIIICFSLFAYGLNSIHQADNTIWWMILMYTSGPVGFVVLVKYLVGLKFISIAKGKFSIRYPFLFKQIKFDSKDLESWTQESVKTYGGLYQEVIWELKSGKKYTLSKQENTEFDKTLKYMKSKFSKIKNK